jgi:hypothetical protein
MANTKRKASQTPIERFLALSDAEKSAEVARFDSPGYPEGFGPLPRAQRKLWTKVKRKMKEEKSAGGRPKVGRGARAVNVTIERGLLERADERAKAEGVTRAQLIAQGIEAILSRPARKVG